MRSSSRKEKTDESASYPSLAAGRPARCCWPSPRSWQSYRCPAFKAGSRITAGILSPATREHISGLLKSHEDRTTNQVAVLTVPTLEGESIEEFATRVFDTWRLGQKKKDNGVLIVVASQ